MYWKDIYLIYYECNMQWCHSYHFEGQNKIVVMLYKCQYIVHFASVKQI